ncbi:MAG: hypothetical protein C0391_06375 [Anaerolinea sp.]|nr:hypothetical protein [Anaerolinea sp.]
MLRSKMGFDWKKSKAHCLLLSKFLYPQNPDDFSKSDIWEGVLGEKPSQSIKRFLDEGLLAVADLENVLSYKYKVSELKDLLKQRGLPISGRKDNMIKRLITADLAGMKKTVAGLTILQCVQHGKELSEKYLSNEQEKRNRVEMQVMEHINKRMFKEASVAVAIYEAEQVFPRGMGNDWKNYNPNRDVEMMNNIFSSKPKIMSKLRDDKLDMFRQGAAMMSLWGKNTAKDWLPPDLTTDLSFDVDTAARMFLFHAIHKTSLEQYRKSGVVKFVEVLAAQDSCDECKKFTKIKYKLNEVPELPHDNCTHEKGCRCTLIPLVI